MWKSSTLDFLYLTVPNNVLFVSLVLYFANTYTPVGID